MPNCSIAIQVLPKSETRREMLEAVDAVIDHIKAQGFSTVVTPFETVVEGEFEALMDLIKSSQIVACSHAPSVMSYIKINYSPDEDILTIDEKTKKHE